MSPFALSVSKWALLVLIYIFVWRAVRSVAVSLREPAAPRSRGTKKAPAKPRKGSRKPPVSLVVRGEDGKKAATHRLVGALEVGREATSPIRLDDQYVSQYHARFFERSGSWFVEDLGSTNGTYLNGERVTDPVPIHAGDAVRIGKVTLELKA